MSFNAGEIVAYVKADTGNFNKGMASVGRSTSKFTDAMKVTATAVAAVSTATSAMGAVLVKSAADLEKSAGAFEVLIGNSEKASKLFGQIKAFADKTPFEFPELAKASKTMLGYGVASEDVLKRLKQLGDASAATGGDLNGITFAYSQMIGRGKVTGDNLRQLTENSVSLRQELSKVSGIPMEKLDDAVSDGLISTEMLNEALDIATSTGGRFFNGTEKLAQTFSGRFSTMKDNVMEFGRSLLGVKVDPELGLQIKKGGLFDRLSNALVVITEKVKELEKWISKNDKRFGEWGNKIKEVVNQVVNYLEPKIIALYNTIKDKLLPEIANLVKTIGPEVGAGLVWAAGLAIDILNALITFITDNTWVVLALAIAFAAVKTAMFLAGAQQAFMAVMAVVRGQALLTETSIGGMTAKFVAFKTLVSMPIFVPALVITAGLMAIAALVAAWKNAVDTINRTAQEAQRKMDETAAKATETAKAVNANPTAENKAAFKDAVRKDFMMRHEQSGLTGNAKGTNNWGGGLTVVGEEGPEIVDLPKGSRIFSHTKSLAMGLNNITNSVGNFQNRIFPNSSMMAANAAGGGTIINNRTTNFGTVNVNNGVDADNLMRQITREDELIGFGLTGVRRG